VYRAVTAGLLATTLLAPSAHAATATGSVTYYADGGQGQNYDYWSYTGWSLGLYRPGPGTLVCHGADGDLVLTVAQVYASINATALGPQTADAGAGDAHGFLILNGAAVRTGPTPQVVRIAEVAFSPYGPYTRVGDVIDMHLTMTVAWTYGLPADYPSCDTTAEIVRVPTGVAGQVALTVRFGDPA
jgi:hypothetical protein